MVVIRLIVMAFEIAYDVLKCGLVKPSVLSLSYSVLKTNIATVKSHYNILGWKLTTLCLVFNKLRRFNLSISKIFSDCRRRVLNAKCASATICETICANTCPNSIPNQSIIKTT